MSKTVELKINDFSGGRTEKGTFKKGSTSWHKGKSGVYSESTLEKMSLVKKGKQPWNKGKKLSIEHRMNLVKSHVGKNTGSENHLWRGGKMKDYPEMVKIRKSSEYNLWRKSCFERDNFICQKTKVSGGALVVHHINNFADFPELRLAIDNGITLSVEAHKEFHRIYGKKNNTKEQLEEFLNTNHE